MTGTTMNAAAMLIGDATAKALSSDLELMGELLPLENATVVELGCGSARMTRLMVERFAPRRVIATEEFEQRILRATHSNHQLDEALYRRVKDAFEAHLGQDGAEFLNPMRLDLLARPGGAA